MVSFYASDFSKSELETQLELLGQMKIAVSGCHLQFCDIHKCFQSLPPAQPSLLSQVSLLVKLIALMPATNAVSERSASFGRLQKICDRICEKVPFLHIFQNLFFVIKAFV